MDIDLISLLVLFCICASFIQRVTGFGFGIFVMTLFTHIMPSYGEATTLSGILAASLSLTVIIQKRKYIQWKQFLPLLITFSIISTACIFMLVKIEDHILKKILGIVLVFASIYFFFFSEKIKLKPNIKTQISMGTISGAMGGFFAMQGPPAVLYFLSSSTNKNTYIACLQAYLFTGNIVMTLFRVRNGFLTQEVGLGYFFGLFGVFLGCFIGSKVFNMISDILLKKIVYLYLAISGIVIFFNA